MEEAGAAVMPGRLAALGSRGRARLVAAVTVLVALGAAASAGLDNSATNDEPYHLLAAWTYVHDGVADLNPEHPPLAKLVAGVALLPLNLHGAFLRPAERLTSLGAEVRQFLYFNTRPSQAILNAGRSAELVFLALLLAGTWAWARELGGEWAAVLATLAVASQPLVLGHAFVVHTDVAAAAGWTWTLYLLHRWLSGEGRSWPAFGIALGLTLLTKFSAVYLVPLAAIAVLVHVLRTRAYRRLGQLAGANAIALIVLLAGYLVAMRAMTTGEEQTVIAAYLRLWPGTAVLASRLQVLAAVCRPLAHYLLGLAYVAQTSAHGQGINFFLGRTSAEGFSLYFPVAFVLKVTLPYLLLAAAGVLAVLRRPRAGDALPLAAMVAYLGASTWTSYNIGARHLLPVVPLLAVVAARRVAAWRREVQGGLAAALLVAGALPFPHYIAHFSLLVGGPSHGARYLNDSNLDWGQDWRRLGIIAAAREWRPISYVYLGAGFPGSDVPASVDALARKTTPPGIYAVSSYAAAVGPLYLRALREEAGAARLVAILGTLRRQGGVLAEVGHTITVYRLPANDGLDQRGNTNHACRSVPAGATQGPRAP